MSPKPTRHHYLCNRCTHPFTAEQPHRYCPTCRVTSIAAGAGDPDKMAEASGT